MERIVKFRGLCCAIKQSSASLAFSRGCMSYDVGKNQTWYLSVIDMHCANVEVGSKPKEQYFVLCALELYTFLEEFQLEH